MLALFKRSGCSGVLIGFESLDMNNLQAMGKRVNNGAKEYDQAVERFRAFGMSVYGTFVFGYDEDTEDSFVQTWRFAQKSKLFFAAFNHLVPFPGTPLYERLHRENRLRYDAWWLSEKYRFGELAFEPQKLTAQQVTDLCLHYRRLFYHPFSVIRRSMDLKANCRNLFMAVLFFYQNFVSRWDVDRRQQLPLGVDDVEKR
jgi:radical SAM superfamily enzyme YgiQ (UPF0313 family)